MCSQRTFTGQVDDLKNADLLVDNIGQLCTLHAGELDGRGPRRREGMSELGVIDDASMVVGFGKILATGSTADIRDALTRAGGLPDDASTIDARGRAVLPGFVDPHTHSVFGKTRQDEYERRIQGQIEWESQQAGEGDIQQPE